MIVGSSYLDSRAQQGFYWAKSIDPCIYSLSVASSDASFRRYFRLLTVDCRSYILVDAPPGKEDLNQFFRLTDVFQSMGVWVPCIYAERRECGFALIEDLGQTSFFDVLDDSSVSLDKRILYYQDIIRILVLFQGYQPTKKNTVPLYSMELLRNELFLFFEWYLPYIDFFCSSSFFEDMVSFLLNDIERHPCVLVHRDYHSRNLMISQNRFAVIDFQDAVIGSSYYDIASLLRDAYFSLSDTEENICLLFYYDLVQKRVKQKQSFESFFRSYQIMSLQRHIKILGIFVRLLKRDGKSSYISYLPRVIRCVVSEVLFLWGENSSYYHFFCSCLDKQDQIFRSGLLYD